MTDEREIEYYTNEAKLGLDLIKDELMVIITMYRKMINEEEI